jgi:glycosyltransferase involved in cell wall biosynthesis
MSTTTTRNGTVPERHDGNVLGRKYKVLFIGPGPVPPSKDPQKNVHFHISAFCEGDFISTHWGTSEEVGGRSLTDLYDTLGSFRYHAIFSATKPRLLRPAREFTYLLRKGLELSRARGTYDAIVAYGPYTYALAGWLIRRWTGARLVILLPGSTSRAFMFEPGLLNKIKLQVAQRYVPSLLRSADALRILFPAQLDELPPGHFPPAFVFPDFVPVSTVASLAPRETDGGGRYALFLGHPFNLKGVDVLIKAFHRISPRYPDFTLKIVGYCPDLGPYRELAVGNPRIEFLPGQPHEKAMDLMIHSTFFVLPSRTEGVPRVLMEAMAARKPVIATRIFGIPYLVGEGLHELLIEPDDVEALASRMERLLDDPEAVRRFGEEGHRRILEHFSEDRYKDEFRKMMEFLTPTRSTVAP